MQRAGRLPIDRPRSFKGVSLLFHKETLQVRGRLLQAQREHGPRYQPEMAHAQGLEVS